VVRAGCSSGGGRCRVGGDQHDSAQHGRSGGGRRDLKFHIKWSGRASRPAGAEPALARRAAGGPVAEQPAGREAGIGGDIFQPKAVGKTRARFPGAHRGFAEPEVGGHLFLGEAVFDAPAFQDDGEIRPQPAGGFHAATLAANAGVKKFFRG